MVNFMLINFFPYFISRPKIRGYSDEPVSISPLVRTSVRQRFLVHSIS